MSLFDYAASSRMQVAAMREQTLNNQYVLTHGGTLGTRSSYTSSGTTTTQYNGNTTAKTVLSGTSNADNIDNAAPYVTINGGAGNDTITNNRRGGAYSLAGAYSNIDGGADNDYIDNKEWCDFSFVSGGTGDDTILSRAAGSTVLGGTGNDSIQNITGGVSINGGAGSDIINDTGGIGTGNTITGGAENDTISLESAAENDLIQYTAGDGNDAIIGFDSSDTLSISGDNYSTATSGSDLIVTVGTGTITIVGAGSTSPNIIGTYGSSTVQAATPVTTTNGGSSTSTTIGGSSTTISSGSSSSATSGGSNSSTSGGFYYPTTNYNSRVYSGGDQVIEDYQSGEQIVLGTMPTGWIFGGGGADMFIGGKYQGSDTFMNAGTADLLFLNDATLSDLVFAGETDSGTVALAFNTGNVIAVQSSEALSSAIMLADGVALRYNHVTKSWQGA